MRRPRNQPFAHHSADFIEKEGFAEYKEFFDI
jgi:hypothetical protein